MSRPSPRNALVHGAVLGATAMSLARCIGMTIRGLDGEIAVLREYWLPRSVTVPLEVVVSLILVLGTVIHIRWTREDPS